MMKVIGTIFVLILAMLIVPSHGKECPLADCDSYGRIGHYFCYRYHGPPGCSVCACSSVGGYIQSCKAAIPCTSHCTYGGIKKEVEINGEICYQCFCGRAFKGRETDAGSSNIDSPDLGYR